MGIYSRCSRPRVIDHWEIIRRQKELIDLGNGDDLNTGEGSHELDNVCETLKRRMDRIGQTGCDREGRGKNLKIVALTCLP